VNATLDLMERSRRCAEARVPAPAARSGRRLVRDRPRVAVIGGGVFGSTCAIELAPLCDVILCERHDRLLTEASFLNQWRHHSGFHYPRSIETIQEVQASKAAFEREYERAIRREIVAYYAVSSLGSEISRERYLAVCRSNGLRFEEVPPPPDILRADRVSVCLKTDEAVVDIDRLTALLMQRLKRAKHIDLRMGTRVASGRLLADGRKRLALRSASGQESVEVDYVVNATYAHTNLLAGWFGFPVRPMRFDLLEMAIFRIPKAARFMMTILDAPFTSLTHTGTEDLFMLSHIHQSILASEVTANGLPPHWRGALQTNQENLLAHGKRYLPLLDRASYVESRVGVRTVEAYNEDFDGRPTVVTAHGFGCWSVLGGKIITAVSNSHEIRRAIERESGLAAAAEGAPR
jgi:glycine/D-amino acid oxidase-like deaminating enzyme